MERWGCVNIAIAIVTAAPAAGHWNTSEHCLGCGRRNARQGNRGSPCTNVLLLRKRHPLGWTNKNVPGRTIVIAMDIRLQHSLRNAEKVHAAVACWAHRRVDHEAHQSLDLTGQPLKWQLWMKMNLCYIDCHIYCRMFWCWARFSAGQNLAESNASRIIKCKWAAVIIIPR